MADFGSIAEDFSLLIQEKCKNKKNDKSGLQKKFAEKSSASNFLAEFKKSYSIINMAQEIIITGGGGYIGSVLTKHLLNKGHKVKCIDRFYFGFESVQEFLPNKNYDFIQKDIRFIQAKDLSWCRCSDGSRLEFPMTRQVTLTPILLGRLIIRVQSILLKWQS